MRVHFRRVAQAIAVGIREPWMRVVRVDLGCIAETITVGIRQRRVGVAGVLGRVAQAVGIRSSAASAGAVSLRP